MKVKSTVLSLVLSFFLIIGSASAGVVDSAASAISTGLEAFFIKAGDHMFDISISGYEDPADRGTISYIYNMASFTPDPARYDVTTKFINFSKAVFAQGYPILLLYTIIILLITHYRTDVVSSIEKLTGVNLGAQSNVLATKAFQGIVIAAFMYIIIYLILELNDGLTKTVLLSSLDTIAPCPDNFILYFMMAISYFILNIFFGIRILIIFLFYSFAFIIGFCLLVDSIKESAMNMCAHFIQAVFFQFVIVLYFSASIEIIKALQLPGVGEFVMYIVMLLGGIRYSYKLMFGTGVIRWVGNKASRLT